MPLFSDELSFQHGPAWRNRLALAPLTNLQSNSDGTLTDDEHTWLHTRALGGFGRVETAAAYVDRVGRAWEGQLGVADSAQLPGLARLAAALRDAGAVSSVQLHHGGLRGNAAANQGTNLAPWDDPAKSARAMTTDEVEEAITRFVDGARLAEEAGFDGASLHAAHGYLHGQFLDPRHNHRTDRFGGSLENRIAPIIETLQGIRAATGPDFQLGIRLTPEGYGIPLDEARQHLTIVLETGLVDYVDLSLWDVRMKPRKEGGDRRLIDHFMDVPRGTTRVGVTGKVDSAAEAQWCLAQGADFVGVGIGAILHHDFAAQALNDDSFAIRDRPVTREDLRAEHLGERFIDYLADGWDDLVG
ncbi:NADH:flavin oxidoreductase [Nocardioides sp. Bht2]|uniref:NADH:flavin oxidoreductase n=1 Tax=Nocardioides sp. Bht2 TaxID=3392297 RepID=UPI0039B4560E